MINNDSDKIGAFAMSMIDAIKFPFLFIYAFTILFSMLGVSFFSGIAVFLLSMYINIKMGVKLKSYRG